MSSNEQQELTRAESSQVQQDPPPTWLAWGVRLASLAILVALLGYLVLTGLASDRPAQVDVFGELNQIEQRGGSWVVPARVDNTGGVSVAQLIVTATVFDASGATVESEDVTVPLLGAGSSADVHFWFSTDPAGRIEFSVAGYTVP